MFPVADGIIDTKGFVAVVDEPVALSNTDTPPPALALATYAHKVTPFVFGMESKLLTWQGLIKYQDSHKHSVTP